MKKNLTNDILYVGVDDYKTKLFEGQFDIPNGISYNSYVIIDEKVAVMDTVDKEFKYEWLNNCVDALGNRKPDYLIVSHMEPDHSANIMAFVETYPETTVVLNDKALKMLTQFFGEAPKNVLLVKDLDELNLGKHTLKFVFAPMVHWPEVMFTYDEYEKVLFSADAFGKFGALDYDDPEGWDCEARRYYFGIVGKYGVQVLSTFKKLEGIEVEKIFPLHGPMLLDNIKYYLDKYTVWASYEPEDKAVFIAYSSVYGNTEKACFILKDELEKLGVEVHIADMREEDFHEAIEDAFRYDRLVLASITYNGGIFPHMSSFIEALAERGYKNRTIALIENGSWAPMANKVMEGKLEGFKNITILPEKVKINGGVNEDTIAQIKAMANALK